MSKRHPKLPPHLKPSSAKHEPSSPESLLQRGDQALNAGYYTEAIELLERAAKNHPEAIPLLAEAHFRRAVAPKTRLDQQLQDLQRATALQPNDAVYYYHLGLAHHRRAELDNALLAYQIAAGLEPRPRGLPFTLALTKLEADPVADLNDIAGLSETERQILETLALLLRGDTSFVERTHETRSWFKSFLEKLSGGNPTLMLWRGLGYLLAGDHAAAQQTLDAANNLAPRAQALRHYYLGVIAAKRGDASAAQIEWEQARARGLSTRWLRENLAAVTLPSARTALAAANWNSALERARTFLRADPAHAAAAQIATVALDRLAHTAARANQWQAAAAQWNEAREIYAGAFKPDATARRLLQNLAIAAERAAAWAQAAEAWRELLRTKPRSKKAKDTFSDAHWTWIRRRATHDLQRAGRLGEAITLMKQKVKSAPNDLAARLELVEALLANQQEVAARNELERILQIDPQHAEARLKLAEWHAQRQEWYAAEMQMQELLRQDPTNEKARRQMAQFMAQRGRSLHHGGQLDAARKLFEQALELAPNHADLYIDLARTQFDLKKRDAARAALEHAYRLGEKQMSTHEQIIRCWIIEGNLDEVNKALARAEQAIKPPPLLYVHLGLECLSRLTPPSPFGPSPFVLPSRFAPPRPGQADRAWEELGKSLVEQGVALNPDDPELLQHVVMDCIEMHLPLGGEYAQRLVNLTPNDPLAWITFGLVQTTMGDLNAAKETLKKAARVARQVGNREAEQTANQFRRELDNPFLSLASGMGLPLGALFEQFAYEDEFEEEEDEEDLFWMPPRRSRRRR